MYNHDIKLRFVNDGQRKDYIRRRYENLLKSFQPFEVTSGKDVAQMSAQEIADILNRRKAYSQHTLRVYTKIVNSYRLWCSKNQVFNDCSTERVTLSLMSRDDRIDTMREDFFPSPVALINRLNEYFPQEWGMPAPVAFCFVWCGLTMVDACRLKPNQVDLTNGIIYDEDGAIIANIDVTLRKFIQDNIAITSVHRHRYVATRAKTSFLIQPWVRTGATYNDEPIEGARIAIAVSDARRLRGVTASLNVDNVSASGALYRLRRLESEGIDVYDEQNGYLVSKCFGTTYTNPKEHLALYNQYKQAFNLQ